MLRDCDLPLLVTGATGVVGFGALPFFHSRYPGQVIGVRPESNDRIAAPHIAPIDVEDLPTLHRLFDQHEFRTVINCAGNCNLKACELDHPMARRLNIDGARNLLAVIANRDVRLVHLSTDLVFSGEKGSPYFETDPVDPVTMYGKTMAEAEAIVLDQRPDALVLRISLPMGPSCTGHAGAIDWISSRFKKSRPATLYVDEIRTPTYIDDMNRNFEKLIPSPLRGLYHFGGPRRLTLFQIAQVINRVGGFDPDLLKGCPRADAGPMPPRAGDVTMDTSRLRAAMGDDFLAPWPLHSWLVPSHPDWHYDRNNADFGSLDDIDQYLYRCA